MGCWMKMQQSFPPSTKTASSLSSPGHVPHCIVWMIDGGTSHRTNKRNKQMTTSGVTSEITGRKETSSEFPAGSNCGTAQLHFPYQQKTIKSFSTKPCLKHHQQPPSALRKATGLVSCPALSCSVWKRCKMRKLKGREQGEVPSLLLHCRKALLVLAATWERHSYS